MPDNRAIGLPGCRLPNRRIAEPGPSQQAANEFYNNKAEHDKPGLQQQSPFATTIITSVFRVCRGKDKTTSS